MLALGCCAGPPTLLGIVYVPSSQILHSAQGHSLANGMWADLTWDVWAGPLNVLAFFAWFALASYVPTICHEKSMTWVADVPSTISPVTKNVQGRLGRSVGEASAFGLGCGLGVLGLCRALFSAENLLLPLPLCFLSLSLSGKINTIWRRRRRKEEDSQIGVIHKLGSSPAQLSPAQLKMAKPQPTSRPMIVKTMFAVLSPEILGLFVIEHYHQRNLTFYT